MEKAKIKRKIAWKIATVALALALIASLFFSSFETYEAAQATASPSMPTATVSGSGGVFPGAPDYTIFSYANGTGTYYAAKNQYGQVINSWTSTNASALFNRVSQNLVDGQTVFVKEGTYSGIDQPILAYGHNNIRFTGDKGALLKAGTKLNNGVIVLSSVSGWIIEGFEINGNAANQSGGLTYPNYANGITLQNCNDCLVENMYLHNLRVYGGNTQGTSKHNGFVNNLITEIGWNGITLGGKSLDYASGNKISHFSDVGVSIHEMRATVKNNVIQTADGTAGDGGNSQWGIAAETGNTNGYNTIIGNTISDVAEGINIAVGVDGNYVSDNTVINWDRNGAYSAGFDIRSNNNTLSGNTLNSASSKGVAIEVLGNHTDLRGTNLNVAEKGIIVESNANYNNIFLSKITTGPGGYVGILFKQGSTHNSAWLNDVTQVTGSPPISDSGSNNNVTMNIGYP